MNLIDELAEDTIRDAIKRAGGSVVSIGTRAEFSYVRFKSRCGLHETRWGTSHNDLANRIERYAKNMKAGAR
jgi:predicted SpoU family rRNA methylase